ncbi:ATP-dependent DNA helicase RecQ [Fructilactobacillus fructivorans]|uniref:RecQ family ATP-dependent DNA helicase n=1 Tax=Fructilactobacillus fructivorans TaxID=1614 RepID=UPI00070A028E|nr:ATP-dependent DNA helicase RecQ [Fructilactobacillus fructivorans]KRN40229.1 ATP-dependent DNA helicase [Fructilactobacillus fructivorans]
MNGMNLATKILNNRFGFDEFKSGQSETIQALLSGSDVLSIMPTGSGKSLIYQLYGYLVNQPVVIVSPLISLMGDQVDRMNFMGEKRVCALNSMNDWKQRRGLLQHLDQFRYIFISPELLSSPDVLKRMKKLNIGLFVIDEAHCISKWGLDFRPEYLDLGREIRALGHPQTLMLTATASGRVQNDIISHLQLTNVKKIIENIDRPNIFLAAHQSSNDEDKQEELFRLINKLKYPGIIYFSSRDKADEIAEKIRADGNVKVASYHAGLSNDDRYRIQHQFMDNELQIICATSAFGMGIDKNDIRFVIHYHMPTDMESYVQEIGRAGRDGKESIAIMLYSTGDEQIAQSLIASSIPSDQQINSFFDDPKVKISEQPKRLLQFYMNHDYSREETKKVFAVVAMNKDQSLRQVISYINNVGCRRKYLLSLFDVSFNDHDDTCCDFGNEKFDLDSLHLLRGRNKNTSKIKNDWHNILARLF